METLKPPEDPPPPTPTISRYSSYDPKTFPYLIAIDSVRNNVVCMVHIATLKKTVRQLNFDPEINFCIGCITFLSDVEFFLCGGFHSNDKNKCVRHTYVYNIATG
jgi:hypothetical protein